MDYYSKYPEIIKIEDKSAGTIIAKMKAIFARHGIPEELMSDNMPYASKEFHQFASEWNIKLTTSSPLYPQSNGQSERFVQTVKQMLQKAKERRQRLLYSTPRVQNNPHFWIRVLAKPDVNEQNATFKATHYTNSSSTTGS